MMRLYTEKELRALRNVDAVKERLDVAMAVYKDLYHSLDLIENGRNADAIREARSGICEAMSRLSVDVRDLVYSDSDAHGISDYWQTPYETLRLGTEDCEASVVLLASICGALGIDAVIVSEPGHVSAGVLVDADDVTVSNGGSTYVVAKTIVATPPGSMKLGSHIVYPMHATQRLS